ncbi:DUF488 domain-containing protein [Solidesulfovibrio carbinolicus]|uniref:DUF488 domain-containing protein n=1 Tax=Solidesulfovibrio carbinolicus TaxID=296842 RepID=A0A4P6HKU6_9BACT|nr:DUF488 domain-containing protein [Solidesulfovibrio carbinolicus]QAZ67585.1 hypothetical protein C3Y92_10245 [Solidesulfovibrio carbinolicus]
MAAKPLARPPIHTIGHGGLERVVFLSLLARQGVNMVIDVRTAPTSRYMPQFSKELLEPSLGLWGVSYVYMGRELGGRPSGTPIEAAVSFVRGIERIMQYWRQAWRLTLLCAEEDPRRCCRAGRIAPELLARGARVVHIRGDGRLEPHTPAWNDFALACPLHDRDCQ